MSGFRRLLPAAKVALQKMPTLRARAKISSQSWRADLRQIWLRRLSETAGVAGLRRGFRD